MDKIENVCDYYDLQFEFEEDYLNTPSLMQTHRCYTDTLENHMLYSKGRKYSGAKLCLGDVQHRGLE